MKIPSEAPRRALFRGLAIASMLLLMPVALWAAPYALDGWTSSAATASAGGLSAWSSGGAAQLRQAQQSEDASQGSRASGPRLVHRVIPRFPPIAEVNFASCRLKAMVKVSDKGEVERVSIVEPCADFGPYFAREARYAISRWKFEPAQSADGATIASVYPCVVEFRW